MTSLSKLLGPEILRDLRRACKEGRFAGIDFEAAMAFLLTDGILPESDMPVESFLQLEDWIRERGKKEILAFTATELKNKTGLIIESVLQGREVTIHRHGRPIALIQPYSAG